MEREQSGNVNKNNIKKPGTLIELRPIAVLMMVARKKSDGQRCSVCTRQGPVCWMHEYKEKRID